MDNGYMQEIRARILAAEDGAVFVAPDFADIADTATIRQGLKRLYQSGIIRRIIRGVYEKPKYSKLLDEYVAADPDAVAKALLELPQLFGGTEPKHWRGVTTGPLPRAEIRP